MVRKIITIDDTLCTGCGDCIPNCPEGAIQLIDGKARLIGDLFCDGLGACLGNCPEGAISVIEREAEPYDERKVLENIIKQGENVVRAHLEHLEEHGETAYLATARQVLKEQGIEIATRPQAAHRQAHQGCPGSRAMAFQAGAGPAGAGTSPSQLSQWPVQLHLISPAAGYFAGKDLLLAADCVAYAVGDFHKDFLQGKQLAIACPKLDDGQESYLQKIRSLVEEAKINTLTVMIMEVPCCGGLLHLARKAVEQAERKIPLKVIVVSVRGEILQEEWV